VVLLGRRPVRLEVAEADAAVGADAAEADLALLEEAIRCGLDTFRWFAASCVVRSASTAITATACPCAISRRARRRRSTAGRGSRSTPPSPSCRRSSRTCPNGDRARLASAAIAASRRDGGTGLSGTVVMMEMSLRHDDRRRPGPR